MIALVDSVANECMLTCFLDFSRKQGLTLSALGLVGGEKVMLEYKTSEGKWPRRRFIEDPGFRQFRENDRVDAMDYQGRWFRGQVWAFRFLIFSLFTCFLFVLVVLWSSRFPRLD